GELAELGANAGVELGAELAERRVQLVVVPQFALERRELGPALVVGGEGADGGLEGFLGGGEEAAHLGRAQLGAADRLRRLVELGAHPEEFLLGEHELGAAALQLGDALGGAGGTGGRVVAFLLPGGAPLDDLLQAAGPALEAAQLLETRLGLA